jgi:hypothetical protein
MSIPVSILLLAHITVKHGTFFKPNKAIIAQNRHFTTKLAPSLLSPKTSLLDKK